MRLASTVFAVCSLSISSHAAESLDRAVVAFAAGDRTFVSWRLLAEDPPNAGFDVLVREDQAEPRKLNPQPITESCNYLDVAKRSAGATYLVRRSDAPSQTHPVNPLCRATEHPGRDILPFVRLNFQGDYPASKVAVGDLDGDGTYDYVIKQPAQVTDPGVWKKSEDTFKVEAYRSDGTFLWRKDLGWNIEQGIWYSPMVVYDFDGDGKAEVVLKTAPTDKDYRNETGRVLDGPEYCTVLDGLSGKELTRVDWIPRGNVKDWGDAVGNRASRHMLGMAYLDGKTPSLLVHRGTYTTMRVDAYNFVDKKLVPLWSWNGDQENPPVRGQGLHGIQVGDIDEDGRDEVILGSAALDDTGKFLWSTGLGHADACYIADLDPTRPGLEIMYGIEPRQRRNAICLVEARTGKIIWGCEHPTQHAHSQGLLADIDPENPGFEFYIGEKQLPERWMYSVRTGKLLATNDLGGLAPTPVYWNDGRTKLYVSRENLVRYKGDSVGRIQGRVLAMADVLGDWREELITSLPGELRVYYSNVPAASRRVCLMQDRSYRTAVAMQTSGYFYPPLVQKDP